MIKLYVKTGCRYCEAVLRKLHLENVEFSELNIADKVNAEDVLRLGGKFQVPFLVDEERGISIYESAMIIDYLDQNYSKSAKNKTNLELLHIDPKTSTEF